MFLEAFGRLQEQGGTNHAAGASIPQSAAAGRCQYDTAIRAAFQPGSYLTLVIC
jgi:hypothetical protein